MRSRDAGGRRRPGLPSLREAGRACLLAALGALLWAAAPEALAQGCAMCRTAVGEAGDPLARALSWSTIFLVAMPFAVFATVGGWIYMNLRSAGAREGGWAEGDDAGNEPAAGGPDLGE